MVCPATKRPGTSFDSSEARRRRGSRLSYSTAYAGRTIRARRRPDGRYSSLEQCQMEVSLAESMFQYGEIPFINITTMSVEEIAATVLHECNLRRRVV